MEIFFVVQKVAICLAFSHSFSSPRTAVNLRIPKMSSRSPSTAEFSTSFGDTSSDGSQQSNDEVGVGLSDPAQSESRRKLLDLINRLHSTG